MGDSQGGLVVVLVVVVVDGEWSTGIESKSAAQKNLTDE